MDQAHQIQTYITVSVVIFLAFAGILALLLANLLTQQALLKKARAQLQQYSLDLEKRVEERTADHKAAEEKYRNLFENSEEAILIINCATGRIQQASGEAVNLFGLDYENLLGKSYQDLCDLKLASKEPRGWSEHLIKRPDGSGRYIDCVVGKIIYEGAECWQLICRDITQKRELEVQLLQSMKMAALGQLAAGVAHELNSPLNAITASNFFIRRQIVESDAKVEKHFEMIETEMNRCRRIIHDLLNFSRSPTPTIELSEVCLNEILENCLGLMEKEIRAGGVSIFREFEELPPIMLDRSRISQVIFNLILNAIQAMPQGGNLTLRTWCASLPLDKPEGTRQICICIEDTGTGISPDVLPNLFTPFYTTKRPGGGVGLGLSVSREIVKLFRGDIKVASTLGQGSKFTIQFPLAG